MARKKANIHYIYKTTCNVTGRWYVGMHSTSNLEDGYMGSGLRLRRSIRKYGPENHIKEILEFLPNREELVLREIEIVNKELIADELCMNLKEGGEGGFSNEEHMIKCHKGASEWQKNNWKDDGFRDRIKIVLLENVKKAHKNGNINYNTFKGKQHSDETKQLMSDKKKGLYDGKNNPQHGTCWITKDGINKKIKKEDLEIYQLDGWIQGRKMTR